jgi:hypothetical protein
MKLSRHVSAPNPHGALACTPRAISGAGVTGSKTGSVGRNGPPAKPAVIEPLPGFKDVPVSERQVRWGTENSGGGFILSKTLEAPQLHTGEAVRRARVRGGGGHRAGVAAQIPSGV